MKIRGAIADTKGVESVTPSRPIVHGKIQSRNRRTNCSLWRVHKRIDIVASVIAW